MKRYKGHTITRCGLSYYVDRAPGSVGGERADTLDQAKALIRATQAKAGEAHLKHDRGCSTCQAAASREIRGVISDRIAEFCSEGATLLAAWRVA